MKLTPLLAIASAQSLNTTTKINGTAQDAFVYGAPLIYTYQLIASSSALTYNSFAQKILNPEGYFQALFPKLFQLTPGSTILPNANVIYSGATINLATPKMVTVPAYSTLGRFSSLQVFDTYTNVCQVLYPPGSFDSKQLDISQRRPRSSLWTAN